MILRRFYSDSFNAPRLFIRWPKQLAVSTFLAQGNDVSRWELNPEPLDLQLGVLTTKPRPLFTTLLQQLTPHHKGNTCAKSLELSLKA